MPATAKAATYEEEQAKLLQQHEGKPAPADEFHIQAPKEPEVDPKVYRDVEPMLFRGFLTVSAEIGDILFTFKSLNQHEFEMLRLAGLNQGWASEKSWSIFFAYCVFMIDGVNILPDRDRWISRLANTFRELPKAARQLIVRQLSEINRRASNAVTLTEAYATETYSRFRWAQMRGLDLSSTSVTGIPGTESLGLNWAQYIWRALNYFEDRNELIEREWEHAKFIGSCMAGKGISKVYQQDNDRRQKEKEERFSRKDLVLRQVLLGEKIDDKQKQLQGAVLVSRRTVEDLTEQLEKDLKGEKDWHDQVIEAHEGRIKGTFQQRREQLETLAKQHEVEFGNRQVIGASDLVGLSPAEVQERMTRRKQLEAQAAARTMVFPELTDPKVGQFMEKWGATGPETTSSVTKTDRDPSGAVPIALPNRPPTKPFGRK